MAQNSSGGSLISKIGSYLQIVTSDPRSTAFVPLAEAYRQIGLLDDALEAASLGTRALPHFSPGFAIKGSILGQMGKIDEAMGAFAQALSIERQSRAALVGLARLHLARGERDQARKLLRQAAEFHTDDAGIRDMLVALDLPRPWDQLKQAVVTAEPAPPPPESAPPTAAGQQPEPIFTATLAEIYVRQGLTDKAMAVYTEILKQNPQNQAVRERLQSLQALARSGETPADQPVGASPPEPPVASAAMPVPAAESPRPAAPRPAALATLERWLACLQQRREHVQ